jgi:type VI secretion system protein ImpJ
MLLSPQHLQALDRFNEAYVAARVSSLAAVDWGVLTLEIDAASLAAGELRLTRFAGILPDGLPVAVDGPENGPPARPVAPVFPASAKKVDVYLAVPREREGVAAYAESGPELAGSRFVAATRGVADATAPDTKVPVRFARPNAVLLLGEERREDHDSMKVAELVRTPAGQIAVAEGYVPPCLRIAASPRLVSGVREVLARTVAKMRELAELRRGRAAAEMTAPDIVRLLQLLVLDAHIPVLAHIAETGDASPRECYLELARLAGQLQGFRGDDPTEIPKLQHADLRATFEPLFALLGDHLGGLAIQQYAQVPVEQRSGGLFLARLGDERLLRAQLFLLVKSPLPEATVVEQLPRLCKIAAATDIQALVAAAAPGLPLRVIHRPPPQLPVRPGVVYFQLVPGDRLWQGIVQGKNLALYLPPPFDPAATKLDLLALLAEEKPAGPG